MLTYSHTFYTLSFFRKYGIGRFERTCLRSKTKLTPDELEAQAQRRKEILTTEMKRAGGITPD